MPWSYICGGCGERKQIGHRPDPEKEHMCWPCRRRVHPREKVPFAWVDERVCRCGCGTVFVPSDHRQFYVQPWHCGSAAKYRPPKESRRKP